MGEDLLSKVAALRSSVGITAAIDPDDIERDEGGRFAPKGGGGSDGGGGESSGADAEGGGGEVAEGEVEAAADQIESSWANDPAEAGPDSLGGVGAFSVGGVEVVVGSQGAVGKDGEMTLQSTVEVGGVEVASGSWSKMAETNEDLERGPSEAAADLVRRESDVVANAVTAANESTPAGVDRPGGEGSLTPVSIQLGGLGPERDQERTVTFEYEPATGWVNQEQSGPYTDVAESLADIAASIPERETEAQRDEQEDARSDAYDRSVRNAQDALGLADTGI